MEKNTAVTFQKAPNFSTAEEKHDKQNNGKKSNYKFNAER